MEVRVNTISVPFSFNQLNATNNVLYGSCNMVGFSITLDEGNYDIKTLCAAVVAAVNTKAAAAAGGPVSLKLLYTKATGKVTASLLTSPGTLTLLFSSNVQLMRMMGFETNVYVTTTGGGAVSQTSDIKVNVNPVSYLFLRSSSLNQPEGSREALLSKGETTDILLDVPVQVSPGAIISWVNPEVGAVRLVNRDVSEVALYLSTNLNFSVDLGGVSWVVSLLFTEVQPVQQGPEQLMAMNMGALAARAEPALPAGASDAAKAALDELSAKQAKARAALEAERDRLMAKVKASLY